MFGTTVTIEGDCPRAITLMWPEALAGDNGYSSSDLPNWGQREIEAMIPCQKDEMEPSDYDQDAIASSR